MTTKLRTQNTMASQIVDTVLCTVKVKVPESLTPVLEALLPRARQCVDRMLANRQQRSSKFYPEIPCVISKSLIAKYQRNTKCKAVKNLVLPLVGDKGRQIKLCEGGIGIPAMFKKSILPIVWPRPVIGYVRSAEFFKRDGVWYASVCYHAQASPPLHVTGVVGVDRNSRENVAVMADRQTGKVQRLGIDSSLTKEVFRNRRSALQRAGKYRLLKKLRRKQRRRMTYENHCVSKTVVEYAATHRRAVAVERLEGVRSKGSKIRRYAEKNQWAFAQLLTFLSYKCALRGVPLLEVDPAYTSQACSRCGSLHAPHGKQFTCRTCGHNDHRDANAAFNIAARGVDRIGESGGILRVVSSGRIGDPQAENMAVLA